VHLNREGNRQIAAAIDERLFGAPGRHDEAYLARLREAVVDKNVHWFHRYRVTDGYSTYGDRAFLTFVRGNPRNVNQKQAAVAAKEDILPTNYEVLQRELPILDVMTATGTGASGPWPGGGPRGGPAHRRHRYAAVGRRRHQHAPHARHSSAARRASPR
jgi:hypothetical protein